MMYRAMLSIPFVLTLPTDVTSAANCRVSRSRLLHTRARMKRGFIALMLVMSFASAPTSALCPFATETQSAVGAQALTDGQLLLRYALGVTSNDVALLRSVVRQPVNESDTLAIRKRADAVRSFIVVQSEALDVDGDRAFTSVDAQIIMRYLLAFRGDALTANLTFAANATRQSAESVQKFIEAGCTEEAPLMAWNAFNLALLRGDTIAAKAILTGTALDVYGDALDALLPGMQSTLASLSQPIFVERGVDIVQLALSRRDGADAVSSSASRSIHFIVLVRAPDGSWLIESL
jgi:Dockerin type I domain